MAQVLEHEVRHDHARIASALGRYSRYPLAGLAALLESECSIR